MTIKRLNLDLWMYPSKQWFASTVASGDRYKKIEPILHRDGWFKRGKECWFEAEGQAYSCPVDSFDYNFKCLVACELTKQETEALALIVKTKLATPLQRELHYFHVLHGNKFDVNAARVKKRFKDFKKKLADRKQQKY